MSSARSLFALLSLKRLVLLGAMVALCVLAFALQTRAANGINRQINYQAKLMDSTGTTVANGSYAIKFSIYDTATSGTALWTASGTTATPVGLNVSISNGLFTVLLGDTATSSGSQNAFGNQIDWNSDSLYLGVTVGADSEMTPRKRLASTPYAFNAERLQGMNASGTTFGANSLFTINQTSNTAATGTRSALEVRSAGTSNGNDFLIRGVNDVNDTVFSLNREGNVSSTGALIINGGATSTFVSAVSSTRGIFDQYVTVNGKLVCLVDGTNCQTVSSSGDANWIYDPSNGFVRLVTSTNSVVLGNTATSTGAPVYFELSGGLTGTSTVYYGFATNTNVVIGGTSTTEFGLNSAFVMDGNDLFVNGNIGSVSSVYTNGEFVAGAGSTRFGNGYINKNDGNLLFDVSGGYMIPATDLGISLGSSSNRFTGDFGMVTTTVLSVTGSATTSFAGAVSTTRLNTNVISSSNAGPLLVTAASGTRFVNAIENVLSADSRIPKVFTLTPSSFFLDVWRSQGSYAYIHNNSYQTLHVLDLTDPTRPVEVLNQAWPQDMADIAVSGDYLYALSGRINVFDIKHPGSATLVYQSANGLGGDAVRVSGRYLYVANRGAGKIRIFDLKNPVIPELVGSYDLAQANRLEVYGDWVFAGSDATTSINVINVKNPANPVLYTATQTNDGINAGAFSVENGRLYVSSQGVQAGVWVYDLSKLPFRQVAKLNTNSYNAGRQPFYTNDKYLFFSNALGQVEIWDIGATSTATQVRVLSGIGGNSVMPVGRYLYASENNNIHVMDLGGIETSALLAHSASLGDLKVEGSAYVGNSLVVRSGAWFGSQGVNTVGGLSGSFISLSATGTTSTVAGSVEVLDMVSTTQLMVNSQFVCLANGTNCPTTSSTSDWIYTATGDFLQTTTGTTNVVIGGTSTTEFGLNSAFVMDGNDLFVNGNIGSVSSVYTNGAFIAGSSTYVGDGFINQMQGNLVLNAAGGYITPSTDLGVSLGSSSLRYNAYFGNVTTTNFATTGLISRQISSETPVTLLSQTTAGAGGIWQNVFVSGKYAVTTNEQDSTFSIYNVENPAYPELLVTSSTPATGPWRPYIAGSNLFLAFYDTGRVAIIDITEPKSPRTLSQSIISYQPDQLQVVGSYLYVPVNSNLDIYDIRTPSAPVLVSSLPVGTGRNYSLYIQRGIAYLANFNNSLYIVDVRNPANPSILGSLPFTLSLGGLAVRDGYAYVAEFGGSNLFTVDVTSSTAPVTVATTTGIAYGSHLVMQGDYLYTTEDTTGEVSILSIASSTNPEVVRTISVEGGSANMDLKVQGNTLYVIGDTSQNLNIYDIGGAAFSTLVADGAEIGSLAVLNDTRISNNLTVGNGLSVGIAGIFAEGAVISSTGTSSFGDLKSSGQYVCLANGTNCPTSSSGTSTADYNWRYDSAGDFIYTATNTSNLLIGGTSTTEFGLNAAFVMDGNDLFVNGNIGSVSSVYTNGAFVAGSGSTHFGDGYIFKNTQGELEISTVSGTRMVNSLNNVITNGTAMYYRGIKYTDGITYGISVYGKYGYITNNNTDTLSILDVTNPDAPQVLTSVAVASQPKYLYATERYVYVGSTNQLSIVDVKNPETASIVGTVPLGIYQNAENLYASGRYVYLLNNNGLDDALHVIDVSNPTSPTTTGRLTGLTNPAGLAVDGPRAYLTEVSTHLLKVVDVSDKSNPVLTGTLDLGVGTQPNTVVAQGPYAYVALFGTSELAVVNVASSTPSLVATVSLPNPPQNGQSISLNGRYIYVSGGNDLMTVDVADPANPVVVNDFPISDIFVRGLTVQGRYAYISIGGSDPGGVQIVDMSGIEASSLIAHSAEIGRLNVLNDAQLAGSLYVGNGVIVGNSGINSEGGISIFSEFASSTISGFVSASSVNVTGDLTTGDILPHTDLVYTVGNSSLRYNAVFGNVTTTNVTSTNAYVTNLVGENVTSTNFSVTGSNTSTFAGSILVSGDVSSTRGTFAGLFVNGASVCLSNGTNCPSTSSATDWVYTATGDFLRANTSTTDIVFGNTVTSTGAAAYFDLSGDANGTSTVYFGFATNTNVLIGGTSTSQTGLNSAFVFDGNDLFVAGNVGSVSSVYTNGDFVAGSGSTRYGNGYIAKNDGNFTFAVSGGSILPSTDQGISLGSSSQRFNGFFGGVTSTNGVFTDLRSTSVSSTNASTTRLAAEYLENYVASSSLFTRLSLITSTSSFDYFTLQGRYLYTTAYTNNTIRVFDLADIKKPRLVRQLPASGAGGPINPYISGRYLYASYWNDGRLAIFDTQDRTGLREVSTLTVGTNADEVVVQGRLAYVSYTGGLAIVDVSNPAAPVKIKDIPLDAGVRTWSVRVQAGYAYVVTNSGNFRVIDVRDPRNAVVVATVSGLGVTRRLDVQGSYVYMVNAAAGTMRVYDISIPTNPTLVSTATGLTDPYTVYVHGRYAYVSNFNSGAGTTLTVFDVSSSTNIGVANTLTGFSAAVATGRQFGDLLFVGTTAGDMNILRVPGISVGGITADAAEFSGLQVRNDSNIGGSVSVMGGLNVGNGIFSDASIGVNATNTTSTFAGNLFVGGVLTATNTQNIFGWKDATGTNLYATNLGTANLTLSNSLIVATGSVSMAYGTTSAILTGSTGAGTQQFTLQAPSGTRVLANLDNPVTAASTVYKRFGGTFNTGNVNDTVGRMAMDGRYVYVPVQRGSGSDLLQIFDISNLNSPTTTGSVAGGTLFSAVYVSGKYAYVSDVQNSTCAMFIFDVSNPANPFQVGCLAYNSSVIRNANDVFVQGKIAYITHARDGIGAGGIFSTVNVANPASPTVLSSVDLGFAGTTFGIYVQGNYAYVTDQQLGLLKIVDISNPSSISVVGSVSVVGLPYDVKVQGIYAYVNSGAGSSISVVNVQNPAAPYVVSTFTVTGGTVGNMQVNGKYLYMANGPVYTVDISNPASPVLVNTSATMNGCSHLVVSGRNGFCAGNNSNVVYYSFDMTGADLGAATIANAEIGELQVLNNVRIGNQLNLGGALQVGPLGIITQGGITVGSTSTQGNITTNGSYISGATTYASGTVTVVGGNSLTYAIGGGFILPSSDLGVSIGSASARFNGYFGNVTTTNVTTTNLFASGTVSTTQLFVNGRSVCLSNGTNCPSGSDWTYTNAGAYLRQASSTTDIVLGNTATSTGAAAYFDLSGTANGTSTVYFGFATNTNVLIGGTSTTQYGLNSLFLMDGNDLFVNGNIGSVSSVYTNGAFVAGTGSMIYADGLIRRTIGDITVSAAGGDLLPGSDLSLTLGASSTRFTGLFAQQVTSTFLNTRSIDATYQWNTPFSSMSTLQLSAENSNDHVLDVKVQGRLAYALSFKNTGGASGTVSIIDMSDPSIPTKLSETDIGPNVVSMEVQGNYVYVIMQGAQVLRVLDVSNPKSPVIVGRLAKPSGTTDPGSLAVSGKYAYIGSGEQSTSDSRFYSVDISNPANPIAYQSVSVLSRFTRRLVVRGSYAYMLLDQSAGFVVIDVKNPALPVVKANISTGLTLPYAMDVQDRYAYVSSNGADTGAIIDLTDPSAPVVAVTTTFFGATIQSNQKLLRASGRYVYVANGGSLQVFDAQSASSVQRVAVFTTGSSARSFDISGQYGVIGTTISSSGAGIRIIRLPGVEAGAMQAGSLEAGELNIRKQANVMGDLNVFGGLSVGQNGLVSQGGFTVYATNTTSTLVGAFEVYGNVSSTRGTFSSLQVGGQSVCLASGTNCPASSSSGTSTVDFNWRYATSGQYVYLATSTADLVFGNTSTSTGAAAYFDLSGGTNGTSTVYFGFSTNTNVVLGGTSTTQTGLNNLFTMNGDDLFVGGNVGSASSVYTNGAFVAGGTTSTSYSSSGISTSNYTYNFVTKGTDPDLGLTGTPSYNFVTTDSVQRDIAKFTFAPGNYSVRFGYDGSVYADGYVTSSLGFKVGNVNVCLQNGTNCPTSSSGTSTSDFNWRYNTAGDFIYTATATTNVLIGGTSTTDTGLNSAFAINGNDLFVNGNIGAVSSVFTNGEFVVGTGSAHYGDGYIRQSSGNITISAAGGSILPNSDLGLTLGSGLLRFNGVFGNVSSSNVTSSRLYVPESTYATIGGISTFPTQSSKTTLGGYSTLALFGRYAIVAGYSDNQIQVLDVNDPSAPTLLASTSTNNGPWNPIFDGRYLYVHFFNTGELQIFDLQHPTETSLDVSVGKLGGFSSADGLFLSGSTLYITDGSGKLFTANVSNPRAPYIMGTVSLPGASGRSRGLMVQNGTAYITNEGASKFYVVDVSNPASPMVKGSWGSYLDDLQELAVVGNYAYAYSSIAEALATFDITSSTNPQQIATTTFAGVSVKRLVASGQYLYGAETDKIAVFDITSSTNPTLSARFGSEDLTGAHDLKVQGRYVYIQDQASSQLFIKQIPGIEASGLMAHDAELGKLVVLEDGTISNRLFVGDAIMVGMGGIMSEGPVSVSSINTTSTFSGNVTVNGGLDMAFTSSTPVQSVYATSSNIATLYGVGARGNTAVVLDTGVGTNNIHIYDISDLNHLKNPKTVHLFNNWPYEVAFGGRYAYISAQGPGSQRFVIVDTQASSGPAVVGSSNQMTQNAAGVAVAGKYAYVVDSANNSVTTFNVSSNTHPEVVSVVTGLTSAQEIAVQGRYAYVTENSGGGGLAILDLADPANPYLLNTFAGASFNQPYGVAVQGNYAYVTNFAVDNVVVVDISNPMDPFEARVLTGPSIDGPQGIAIQGRYGYVVNGFSNKLVMFDATNPAEAFLLPDLGLGASKVAVNGNLVLATDNGTPNSFRIYDVGGMDVTNVKSDSVKTYALEVMGDANIGNRVNAGGGLTVGQGGAQIDGGLVVTDHSASSVASFVNTATSSNSNWGAYINKLLVGNNYTTGSNDFAMVVTHSPLTDGLCITQDINHCPDRTGTPVSIVADNSIAANAFDVAERFPLNGFAEEGDLLILDQANSRTVKQSDGTPYDGRMIGVYSTDPGFLLGFGNSGAPVALTGRVPLKVSTVNGTIDVGDPLTSSPAAGYAMKATHPGMVVGYALEATTGTTSTISVFVNVGFDAKMALGTDATGQITQVTDDLVLAATSTATGTNPFVDSWGLTFRGSAWNGTDAVSQDFRLFTDILSATSSQFTIRNTSSSNVFTINQAGAAELTGDLSIGGKLYPSARGTFQSDKYIFLDDSLGPTSTYMSTNADGWQSETSYDFAERFYSPDSLSPGDVVTISAVGQSHVQRSLDERAMPIGIVSTRPAFVAGAQASSTYPIALSGRVPTNVSTIKGEIKAGDALAPSSIPGVAVKAVGAGPVVGYALEDFAGTDVGKIQVYVNPGWHGGSSSDASTGSGSAAGFSGGTSGFAVVYAGQTSVQVSFASLGAFPMVQVTPYGEVSGSWWIRSVSDTGFEIVFRDVLVHDVMFAWQAAPSRTGQRMSFSDGTEGDFDPSTGIPFGSRNTPTDETPSSAGSTSTDMGSASSTDDSAGAGVP